MSEARRLTPLQLKTRFRGNFTWNSYWGFEGVNPYARSKFELEEKGDNAA